MPSEKPDGLLFLVIGFVGKNSEFKQWLAWMKQQATFTEECMKIFPVLHRTKEHHINEVGETANGREEPAVAGERNDRNVGPGLTSGTEQGDVLMTVGIACSNAGR